MAPIVRRVLDLVFGQGEDMRALEYLVYITYENISTWQENLSSASFMKRTNDPKVSLLKGTKS